MKFIRIAALLFFILPSFASAAIVNLPTIDQPGSGELVGMILENPTGSAIAAAPVQTGQVFIAGNLAGNSSVVAAIKGSNVPTQIDVKTKYSDGSVKFGVITMLAPALSSKSSTDVMLKPATVSGTPLSLSTMPGYSLSVSLTTSSQTYTFNVANLLATELAAGRVSYWRKGPVVTEGRFEVPVVSSMRLVFDVSKFADGTYSTDVHFNNDLAMTASGDTLTYTAAITEDGQEVYKTASLTHHQYQTWHKVIYSTGIEPMVNVQRDIPYLLKTGALLNFDTSYGIDEDSFSKSAYTEPLSPAGIATYMPMTGGRDDIGPTTGTNAAWLLTQNAVAAKGALAQADGAGSVPWHFYDPTTKDYLSLDKYPTLWADGRGNPTLTQFTKDTVWSTDTAHKPELSFIPYLFTGSRYYLDQINAEATFVEFVTWNWPRQDGKGVLTSNSEQVRAAGWNLRQLDIAAWANPDGTATQAYWQRILNNNLDHLLGRMAAETAAQGEAYGYFPAEGEALGDFIKPWMHDYLLSGIAGAATHGNPKAKQVVEWMSNHYLGRYNNISTTLAGSNYTFNIFVGGVPVKKWSDISNLNLTFDGGQGSYGQSGLMSLANIYNVTGSAEALATYDKVKALNPPYTDMQSYAKGGSQFKIVPRRSGSVVIPPTPTPTPTPVPVPTGFSIGDRVSLTTGTNVRATANGTILGTQPVGALGTLVSGPATAGGYSWWSVNYDTGLDGYSVDMYMAKSTAPTPDPEPTPIPDPEPVPTITMMVTSSSIVSGQSTTLSWSTTNATKCASTGFADTATAGSVSVSPTNSTTYTLTCTGVGGSATKSVVVLVTAAPVTPAPVPSPTPTPTPTPDPTPTPSTVSPDGSVVTVGSKATLTTTDGVWSFSTVKATGGYRISLNGKYAQLAGTKMIVQQGGKLYAQTSRGQWYVRSGQTWIKNTNPGTVVATTTTPAAPTPTPTQPTLSPDGTTITVTTGGSVITSDGTWSFGTKAVSGGTEIYLNGVPAQGGGIRLTVANGGKLYTFNNNEDWYLWKSGSWTRTTDPNVVAVTPPVATEYSITLAGKKMSLLSPLTLPAASIKSEPNAWVPRLVGTAASDVFEAVDFGGGATYVSGGGDDVFYITSNEVFEGVVASANTTIITRNSWGTYAIPANIDNVIQAGNATYNLKLEGNSGSNIMISSLNVAGDLFKIDGKGGNDTIVAGPQPEEITVTSGNGSDTIINFTTGSTRPDSISLTSGAFASWTELRAALKQVGSNVVLTLKNGETLTFANKAVADFTPTSFVKIANDWSAGSVLGASTINLGGLFTQRLSLRSSGEQVRTLQLILKRFGYFGGEATGYFGPLTESAVKSFQAAHALEALGIVGPQTRKLLVVQ